MLSSRGLLAALIVAATALFVAGVSIERNSTDEHTEPAAATETKQAEETHVEGEAGGHSEAEESHGENAASEETADGAEGEEASEEILGVDPESTPLVVLAVIASLGLAAAVIRAPRWAPLLWLVAIAMVAFAALDLREVFHQIDENREGLALLAGAVAILHALAAAISARQAVRNPAV
jgi:hypothetical protein